MSEKSITPYQINKAFNQAKDEIRSGLKPFGYYQADINAQLTQKKQQWHALFKIKLGSPLRVKRIDIKITDEGKKDNILLNIKQAFPLKKGQQLNHKAYEQGKTQLINGALNRGYLDAQLKITKLLIDLQKNQAIIKLHLATGPRYGVANIRFHKSMLSPQLLSRYLPKKPPFAYSSARMIAIHEALNNSNHFSLVKIKPQLSERDKQNRIPIDILLSDKKTHRIGTGIGYATDTGARTTINWDWRHLNPAGHSLATRLYLSQIGMEFSTQYKIPLEKPNQETLKYYFAYKNEFAADPESESIKVGINARLVTPWKRKKQPWIAQFFSEYLAESFEVGNKTEDSNLWLFGLRMTNTWANRNIYPTKGHHIGANIQTAIAPLLSSTSLLQGRLFAKSLYAFNAKNRIKYAIDIGATWVDDFSKLPNSLRFFAGGDNSVRGYSYESIGPQIDAQVVGGKYLITSTIEYDYRIKEKWAIASFIDAGLASDTLNSGKFFVGYGIGMRWFSPVGIIRIDIAIPHDTREDTWRLHINIGPDL